ncbi:MAG TPA: YddF family protein [Defluviitaleaceae bacterium]|nr:YddF family protein [Candidatus Epulonipiscium sp.]HOQ16042.1 YddF family protein [Defluviitaleaceae bacterium]HPT76703.1 YddF family protein [Defluviitaleaceae bacterium]HQD50109.1 YddF family protein [Defluviitaleaceae bacterium]
MKNYPIALFNGTVATTDGLYRVQGISVDDAKKLIEENGFISAIGHKATAEIMSDLLGINIPMNRIDFKQEIGQKAVVFKLKKRPPEGSVLTKEQIEATGYEFKLMERIE